MAATPPAKNLQDRFCEDGLDELTDYAEHRGPPVSTVVRSLVLQVIAQDGDLTTALDKLEPDFEATQRKALTAWGPIGSDSFSKRYSDRARTGEQKRTSPSTQSAHWFAGAVLAAMRLRGKEPGWRSVIALPDFSRGLVAETRGSLSAAGITLWWVDQEGSVEFD